MLPVSLDCPFLMAPSVFSTVYVYCFLFGNRLSKRFEKDNIKVFDKNKNVDIKFIAHNASTFVPCYLDHDRCSILSVPDEGYSRNALCALNLISTFH